MKTGIKALDKVIMAHGISFKEECDNKFQKNTLITSINDTQRLNLPYCILEKIKHEGGEFILQRFYLPHLGGRKLGDLLLNKEGELLEKVCYSRNCRYKEVFKKIVSFNISSSLH